MMVEAPWMMLRRPKHLKLVSEGSSRNKKGRAWQLEGADTAFPELAEEPDCKGDDLRTYLDEDAGVPGLQKYEGELRNQRNKGRRRTWRYERLGWN